MLIKAKNLIFKNKFIIICFFILFIPRIIGLGIDTYGIDAHLWDMRSDKFINAVISGNFIETNQKYHPGVTLMWLSGVSKKLLYLLVQVKNGYSIKLTDGVVYPEWFFIKLFVAKLPIVTLISALFTYCAWIFSKLKVSKGFIYIFLILISVEPFFLGISRFYHLTGLEVTLGFTSLIVFYYYLVDTRKKYLVLSALFFALGLLTKTSVFIFSVPLALVYLAFLFSNYELSSAFTIKVLKKLVVDLVTYLLLISLFFVIFWPAMWVKPFWVLQDIYRSGIQDRAFVDNPSPSITNNKYLYYYEMLFIRSSALTLVAFIASGVYFKKISNKHLKFLYLTSFIFVPYYALIMALPEKQIDRYVAVMFPFVIFCASAFIYFFIKSYSKYKYLIVGLLILYFATLHWVYYPNYSSTFSEFIGGARGYSKYDKVKNRGEFYIQLVRFLNAKDGKESYNKSLVIPHGGKDLSAPGYLGSIYTDDGLDPRGRGHVNYYAPDYLDLAELPANRDCKKVNELGYRWPLKFTYLYVYECN